LTNRIVSHVILRKSGSQFIAISILGEVSILGEDYPYILRWC
jgi:hypothetical protein